MTYTAYCVKCKVKREMKNAVKTVTKGRAIVKGQCKVCGTNMAVFVKA